MEAAGADRKESFPGAVRRAGLHAAPLAAHSGPAGEPAGAGYLVLADVERSAWLDVAQHLREQAEPGQKDAVEAVPM
jgi:hypothetical protein